MSVIIITLISAVLLVAGCASKVPVNLYDGPARLDKQVAIISDCKGAFFDVMYPTKTISGSTKEFSQAPGRILPGEYVMTVTHGNRFSRRQATFSISVEAEKKYTFCKARLKKATSHCGIMGGGKGFRKFFWIEDSETKAVIGGTRPHTNVLIAKEKGHDKLRACKAIVYLPLTGIYGETTGFYYANWEKGFD